MVIVLAANKSDLGDPRAFLKATNSPCPSPTRGLLRGCIARLHRPHVASRMPHLLSGGRVRWQEAKEYAKEQSLPMFTCSAKTGENVQELFNDLGTPMPSRDPCVRATAERV